MCSQKGKQCALLVITNPPLAPYNSCTWAHELDIYTYQVMSSGHQLSGHEFSSYSEPTLHK